MKQIISLLLAIQLSHFLFSCNGNTTVTTIKKYDENVLQSVITNLDSLRSFDFLNEHVDEIKRTLLLPCPIMLCKDPLDQHQQLAQRIAIQDSDYTKSVYDTSTGIPYRCEIFGVYPARESDLGNLKANYSLPDCFRVEMYNYGTNTSTIGIADIRQMKMLAVIDQSAQADIPAYLKTFATRIAVESPEVQQALGIKPSEKDALMASTKSSLNRTRCERSGHLCVAPTFIKGGKALWAIVDLTDYRLVGVRWTNVGTTGTISPITEKKLQDDKITACFCERETSIDKEGWQMNYMLTSSDGLRISDVSYHGKQVLKSAKLVDWHVSYSGTDGFGYSDAVGCPWFSQAAVVAYEPPKIAELRNEKNIITGFVLEQTFRSRYWPSPCNYNYCQRFEFYKDGKFRVAAASLGRGCGNDGTYRPVFRIAFASERNNFSEWNGRDWTTWTYEKWVADGPLTSFTPEGYQFRIIDDKGIGYFVEPGTGKFKDGGRGDNAYVYATVNHPNRDEGESDLITIGPCCNTDYHQGPEKFIEPVPDSLVNKQIVLWYVAQLKNDDSKGNEYCWAESVLKNGVYITQSYPCFCGPLFIPVK